MSQGPRETACDHDATEGETRSGAYLLLADLLERGLTPSLRSAAEMSPILAQAMDQVASQDELDASHTSAFGLQVFPYAGVFLHPTAQAGAGAAPLYAVFRALAFDPDPAGPGVDHLATTLRALGYASALEANVDGLGEEIERVQGHTRELFDGHLLRWLPVWVSAVRRLGQPWPTALALQILELALLHRSELGAYEKTPWLLPPLLDLDAKETDLRAITEALMTPAVAGLFLSRADVSALARGARAPTGFGPRTVVLQNAFQSAARYDTLTEFTNGIREIYKAWARELDTESARALPGLAESLQPWRERAGEAIALLERIRVAARNAAA